MSSGCLAVCQDRRSRWGYGPAYGLPDRGTLLETILWWQDRCRRGIEAEAADGDPAMIRLRDGGAAWSVSNACDRNRTALRIV